jgi:hypothetical protein
LALLVPTVAGSGDPEPSAEVPAVTHFEIVTSVDSPSAAEIGGHLERTWMTFRDLFGVEADPVKVVLSAASGSAETRSQTDQAREGATQRTMAWMVLPGEDLDSQGFNDLSHEIAHIYFLDVMGNPGGLHQEHAWLHEAVACYHESEPFLRNRRRWMREHLNDRIPLQQLFVMQNPVKQSRLVEMTAELHGQLARGEIDVIEMNERISEYARSHAADLARSGIVNMTYYAQSLSFFEFLLEREGKEFVRRMAHRLRDGESMEQILLEDGGSHSEIALLEASWVEWVKGGRRG